MYGVPVLSPTGPSLRLQTFFKTNILIYWQSLFSFKRKTLSATTTCQNEVEPPEHVGKGKAKDWSPRRDCCHRSPVGLVAHVPCHPEQGWVVPKSSRHSLHVKDYCITASSSKLHLAVWSWGGGPPFAASLSTTFSSRAVLFKISFVSTKISKMFDEARLPVLRPADSWKRRRSDKYLDLIFIGNPSFWDVSERDDRELEFWVLWFYKLSTCRAIKKIFLLWSSLASINWEPQFCLELASDKE